MVITALVAPELLPMASMAFTTSMPEVTCPNTTCFPSSQLVTAVVMKNCDPLVLGPLCVCVCMCTYVCAKDGGCSAGEKMGRGGKEGWRLRWWFQNGNWQKTKRSKIGQKAPIHACLLTCVRHGEEPRDCVRAIPFVKLVSKFSPVNRLSTGAVATREVAALKHEAAGTQEEMAKHKYQQEV